MVDWLCSKSVIDKSGYDKIDLYDITNATNVRTTSRNITRNVFLAARQKDRGDLANRLAATKSK